MRRTMLAVIGVIAAALPAAAGAQIPTEPLVVGDVPEGPGVATVTISYPAPASDVDAYLAVLGCEVVSLAVTVDGEWRAYVPGAPAFVNEAFPEPGMGDVVLVRCGEPSGAEVNSVHYTCADGKSFIAHVEQVPATRTIVEVAGRTMELEQTVSGSGIRYVSADGSLMYLSQGNTATIEQGGVVTYADCVEQPSTSVAGTIDYAEQIAVPADAVVTVRLVDVSLQDVAATEIASHSFEVGDGMAPFSFDLAYDADAITSNATYHVQAEVRWGEHLLYTTDTAVPVITDPAQTQQVALSLALVEPAVTAEEAAPLIAHTWRWKQTVDADGTLLPNTPGDSRLTFDADGAMGTSTDCNSYFGLYTVRGDQMAIDVQGGTLMFCPADTTTEGEYIEDLGRVTGYTVTATTLTLDLPDGRMEFVAE